MKQAVLFIILFTFCLITSYAQSNCGSCDDKPNQPKEILVSKGQQEDFKVFPNPAEDFIELSSIKGVNKINVFNLVGRQMKTFNVTEDERYYVADLPLGIYLIQLVGGDSKVLKTQRISKR